MKYIQVTLLSLLLCGMAAGAGAAETYVVEYEWGSPGSGDSMLNYPYDVSLDDDGSVYVVDGSNNRAKKFTPTGTFLRVLNADLLFQPSGVVADAGRVYVTDCYGVTIYPPDGDDLGDWTAVGGGPGQLAMPPAAMGVDTAGRIYVADRFNNRVQAFWPNGTFSAFWQGGQGGLALSGPRDVAVNASGYVYVTDTSHHRVQVYDPAGAVVGGWGAQGPADWQFNTPLGIAVDGADFVYVADCLNHRIEKFRPDGALVDAWGTNGDGPGQLKNPWGVAVDGAGRVYVTDSGNHRVQTFRLAVLAVPPGATLPTDTDRDGRYDDVNGNGRKDFADVVLYFNQMAWIAANEPVSVFDFNGNGRIDFADVVLLFNRL